MIGGKMVLVGRGKRGAFSFGNALEFDGVNDFVSLSSSITTSTDFAFFIMYNQANNDNLHMLASNSASNLPIISLATVVSVRRLNFRNNATILKTFTFPSNTIKSGVWQKCLINSTNGTVRVYIDGIEATDTFTISTGITINQVGCTQNGDFVFDGFLDNFFMLDRAMTTSEMTDIFSESTNFNIAKSEDSEIFLEFNETEGTTAEDSSGNSNNGTLNNFNVDNCPFDGSNDCPWQPH
jgi:hypothetical protein